MIVIISKKNCSQCVMVKNLLKTNNVEHIVKEWADLDKIEQNDLLTKAREKNNMSFPLIFKDAELINIDDLIIHLKN